MYDIPTGLSHLVGSYYVRTANDSKTFPATSPLLTLTTPGPSEIYLFVDTRYTPPWLPGSWTDTGHNVRTTENGTIQTFRAHRRTLAAGGSLDVNGLGTTATSQYFLVVYSIPAAPNGLGATPCSGRVTLSWNPSPGAVSYTVLRGTAGSGLVTIASGLTQPSHVDTSGTLGTTYLYRVRAVDADGRESADSNEVSALFTVTPPAPATLTAKQVGSSVTLTWSPSVCATSYALYRSTTSGCCYLSVASNIGTTSHIDTSGAQGVRYYYRVRAINAAGASGYSPEASAVYPVVRIPVHDTYVRDGVYANTNFGTETNLAVKYDYPTDYNRIAYLRFSIAGLPPGSLASVKVRLYGYTQTSPKSCRVSAVADVTWSETSMTWNNRPAIGTQLGNSLSVGTSSAWREWDVTSYVQSRRNAGATEVSFAIQQDSANAYQTIFNSEENTTNDPQLVVHSY
jgi:hypothetical protein